MSRVAFLLLVLVALTSCNGGADEKRPSWEISAGGPVETIDDPVSPIKTLAIRPAYAKIVGPGNTLQLTAHVWLTDGGEEVEVQDMFNLPDPIHAEWSTENYGIASVDEKGLVTAVSSGDTFVHVQIDGKEAIARVIVESKSSLDPNIDIIPTPL